MDRDVSVELDLIGAIYDAVLDPSLWNETVDRIRVYMQLHLGVLAISYLPSGINLHATTNVRPEHALVMAQHGHRAIELWGGFDKFNRIPLEEPVLMSHYTHPDLWPGNPFYEEFAKPAGIADQIVLVLENRPTAVATFGLGQHQSMPPIGAHQLDTFRLLGPHLRRAVLITNLLEMKTAAASSFEAALDVLAAAVLLVDATGRVVYANARAESMLRSGDPVIRIGGRLDVPRELVKGQLDLAIAAAASGEEGLRHAGGIAVRQLDGSGAVIHVMPLQRRSSGTAQAVAAIFVAQPQDELDLPLEAMRLLYDLRPAEARVLQLIAAGRSGRDVAAALGISTNTAKTHTLRLFDKLGVHSRAELVRLVRDMSLGGR